MKINTHTVAALFFTLAILAPVSAVAATTTTRKASTRVPAPTVAPIVSPSR